MEIEIPSKRSPYLISNGDSFRKFFAKTRDKRQNIGLAKDSIIENLPGDELSLLREPISGLRTHFYP